MPRFRIVSRVVESPFLNPYDGCRGGWIRGNIHGHTREHSPCGSVPLRECVEIYRREGAAFMAVTDHDHVTDLAAARRIAPDMVFLEGFEYSTSFTRRGGLRPIFLQPFFPRDLPEGRSVCKVRRERGTVFREKKNQRRHSLDRRTRVRCRGGIRTG